MHDLQQQYQVEIEEMVAACHRLAAQRFVTSHGGNLSCRVATDVILITPTKHNKGDLRPEDIVFINMQGSVLHANEGLRPTGEVPLHLAMFRERADVRTLVHAHPPAITGLAIAHSPLLARPLLPEPIQEIGPVLPVPYAEPLSQELADAFLPLLRKSNAFLMLNHGLILCTPFGMLRGVELLEMLEAAAQSIAVALAAGTVHELSREDLANMDRVMCTRQLPYPGAPGEHHSLVDLYFGQN
jgi:L-fuculose-phosphate aldolase